MGRNKWETKFWCVSSCNSAVACLITTWTLMDGVGGKPHVFVTSGIDGGKWSVSFATGQWQIQRGPEDGKPSGSEV
jgi:hypothetical protein